MYNKFKNDFLLELKNKTTLSTEELSQILLCFDMASYNYEITEKQTQLVLYNQELPQIAKTFIACKSIEGFSKGTLYNYKTVLTNLFFTLKKSPETVTTNDIRIYLYKYQQERGISNRSLDKVRNTISAFYKWMTSEGYVEKDPTLGIRPIKYEKKPKTPCSQVDLEYLRRACITPKQRAILEFFYSTGCRVGELVILKKSDIDWSTKSVHLFGKGQKHRTSFLNAKAEVALREYLNSRKDNNEWLFVSDRKPYDRMHVCGIQKIIREMTKRASDDVKKNVTPHVFRHTFASRLIENDADITSVQKLLGHENINTTITYIHKTIDSAKIDHAKAVV